MNFGKFYARRIVNNIITLLVVGVPLALIFLIPSRGVKIFLSVVYLLLFFNMYNKVEKYLHIDNPFIDKENQIIENYIVLTVVTIFAVIVLFQFFSWVGKIIFLSIVVAFMFSIVRDIIKLQ